MDVEEEVVSLFEDDVKPVVVDDDDLGPVEPKVEVTSEFVVPDKFKGKSIEDVIESYVNLESSSGRTANELGDLRKLTDQILQQQVAVPPAPVAEAEQNDVGFDDFIEDPSAAVNKAMNANPRIQALESSLMQSNQRSAHNRLVEAHADADEVVASPTFQTWVQENSSRATAFQRAHQELDIDAATDLLSLYKQTQKVASGEAENERDAQAAADLKLATVETGRASTSEPKVYLRSDLIRLKMQDPQRYSAMESVIQKAYADKRVR